MKLGGQGMPEAGAAFIGTSQGMLQSTGEMVEEAALSHQTLQQAISSLTSFLTGSTDLPAELSCPYLTVGPQLADHF